MSELTLHARLRALGIVGAADGLDDLVALATQKRWSPTQILEHVADMGTPCTRPRPSDDDVGRACSRT